MPSSRASDQPYFDVPPLALAHRGGAAYGPNVGVENSLAAFRRAVELGYRYLETDVHATRDGQLVAFHDDHLDRVTDGRGAVGDLPWSVVRRARIDGREPIPRLAELLEELPTARVNIDIKAGGAVGPLWEVIRAHSAQHRVCVGSFSDQRLAAFRRLAGPTVATTAGPRETAVLRFGPARLGRLLTLPGQVLQIPEVHHLAGRPVRLLTPRLLDRAHRLGKQVHVWTVDRADDIVRLLDLGVDGIVSDRIDTLRAVLTARGQWRDPQG